MWMSWRAATEKALYAKDGFYGRVGQPARHYRTSVHVSERYAAALLTLLDPSHVDVVDVGAGSGGLLASMPGELRLTAVDVAPRPAELPERIAWLADVPESVTGLVVANEWLDNIPVDVVELTVKGPRLVLVDPSTGMERLGDRPEPEDLAWLERWWPLGAIGDRAEIGLPRDEAWAAIVRRVKRGVIVAADYSHSRSTRPATGTLTGYRDGREVLPVPDGSCDVTAHVALDACAAAGSEAGAQETLLTTQREALRSLGVRGERPPLDLARTDPPRYIQDLRHASEEGELIDTAGLGRFGWLVQSIDTCLPAVLGAKMA
jgi:SAM-dependent MidA family methyltransferase